jgi:hypothetical protein
MFAELLLFFGDGELVAVPYDSAFAGEVVECAVSAGEVVGVGLFWFGCVWAVDAGVEAVAVCGQRVASLVVVVGV